MAIQSANTIVSSAFATVTGAIRDAARATGTSFNYLLATAHVESRLNPNAAAPTSTASGLFQFIEQTWLGTLKESGAEHGYGQYADAIGRSADNRFHVADPALRDEIMRLRFDPAASAAMAAAFTNENASYLAGQIGRPATEGELYIAHFFGAGAASRLINLAAEQPDLNGAALFPQAAHANRSIFYDRQGNARSISQVYGELVRRYEVARAQTAGPNEAVAAAMPVPRPMPPVVPATAPMVHAFAASMPGTVSGAMPGVAPTAVMTPAPGDAARPAASQPVFHGLFHTGPRATALAPVVNDLWGAPTLRGTTQEQSPRPVQANVGRGQAGFDLFRDAKPNARAIFDGSA